MKQVLLLLQICLCCVSPCFCQDADTLETKRLDEVLIRGQKEINMSIFPILTVPGSGQARKTKLSAYGLFDVNASWKINDHVMLRVNVKNVTDKQYFTKRPQFYPGPGVWSSDGRSFVVTLGFLI